jgi:hypothetical protein
MLEIIALVAAVVVIVWTPIEAAKVRGGWVRGNFKGTAEDFRARYRKQIAFTGWLGIKLGIAAAWAAAGAVAFWCRARLPAAAPVTPDPGAR